MTIKINTIIDNNVSINNRDFGRELGLSDCDTARFLDMLDEAEKFCGGIDFMVGHIDDIEIYLMDNVINRVLREIGEFIVGYAYKKYSVEITDASEYNCGASEWRFDIPIANDNDLLGLGIDELDAYCTEGK